MRIGCHGGPDAGVLGATTDAPHQAVLVAGLAGIIAEAPSMGSGGYLAAKSERGVWACEIAMARAEGSP